LSERPVDIEVAFKANLIWVSLGSRGTVPLRTRVLLLKRSHDTSGTARPVTTTSVLLEKEDVKL
jgi:hypothetical protein